MCGIAGWVDFARDVSVQAGTVRTMVSTLANRGPDSEGVWAGSRAALGFRRLAVIDLVTGDQPMIAEDGGEPIAVLVHNGEIYNFRRLRQELTTRGHRFRTTSDTEVVLRAYLEWGQDCAQHLEGMFAFAVWDERRQRLSLFRDRLGVKPLYYFPLERGVLFGSEPKALLSHPLVDAVVDAEGLAEVLGYAATPGNAVYRGMHEVRPGHVVVVHDGSVSERAYWSLPGHEHRDDWATSVRTVRELLTESVAAQLVSDVPLCVLLSGGVDSSAITAMARGTGSHVTSFAVDYDGHSERFQQVTWHKDGSDARHAALVAEHTGTQHETITLQTAEMLDPVVLATTLRAQDLPRPIPDMDSSLYLLLRSVRERCTVALMGEIADELFGGYESYRDPNGLGSNNFPWVSSAMRAWDRPNGMYTGMLDPELVKVLDIPEYTAARYQDAAAEVPHVDGESADDRRMRTMVYLHLTRWLPLLLARDDRLSMAVGLELRVPFDDRRLVEYVFNIPWSMKNGDGPEKRLLRAAVADLLPASVLRRRKSPFPYSQDPNYGEVLRNRFQAVLADPGSPVRPLVDGEAGHELLRSGRAIDATGWGERRDVEMILQLDAWLRHYRVRLEL